MSKPDWTLERAEIERVAQEYRQKGYEVFVAPNASQLPDFLREYPPDIIARGPADSVVIEVKQRVTEGDRLSAIARRVKSQPGWRFVLVSPGMDPQSQAGDVDIFDPKKIRALLRQAESLATGHQEAAVLLSWAALEAAMRLAARRYDVESPRPDTWSLLRELVSNGLVDRTEYQTLTDVFRYRSAIAHGLQPVAAVDAGAALSAISRVTRDLVSESTTAV